MCIIVRTFVSESYQLAGNYGLIMVSPKPANRSEGSGYIEHQLKAALVVAGAAAQDESKNNKKAAVQTFYNTMATPPQDGQSVKPSDMSW